MAHGRSGNIELKNQYTSIEQNTTLDVVEGEGIFFHEMRYRFCITHHLDMVQKKVDIYWETHGKGYRFCIAIKWCFVVNTQIHLVGDDFFIFNYVYDVILFKLITLVMCILDGGEQILKFNAQNLRKFPRECPKAFAWLQPSNLYT